MPGFLVHVGAVITCTHAAPVNAITSNTRVLVNGLPVVTIPDTYLVTGCPFTLPIVPPKSQPCVQVQWLVPASKVLVNGQFALVQSSTGLCFSVEQIPQGPPLIVATQPRVSGL